MSTSQDIKTVDRLDHGAKVFSHSNWVYLKKILNGQMKNTVSPILTLDLTQNCNFDCNYCVDRNVVTRSHRKEIPWEILKGLLTELKKRGCRGIEMTGGGEPTLYTKFDEVLKYSTELNLRMALVSNGSLFLKYIDLLKSTPFDWIRVSIDAGTPNMYGQVHGTKPSVFKDTLDSIEILAQSKVIGISYIVLPVNYEEIFESAKLVKDMGVRYFEVKPLLVSNTKNVFGYEHRIIQRVNEQFEKIRELEDNNFKIISPKSLSYICDQCNIDYEKDYSLCWAAYLRTVLTPSGVFPCSYYRGRSIPSPFPTNADELVKYRNKVINGINPSISCKNYCGRDDINKIINNLFRSIDHSPELVNYFGWPIDYGEDVLWL